MKCVKRSLASGTNVLRVLVAYCSLLLYFAPPLVSSFGQGLQIQASFNIYCNRRASQRFPVHYDVAACNGLCEPRRNVQHLLNIKVNASTYFRVGVEVLIEVEPARTRNLNIVGFGVVALTDDDRIVGRFLDQRDVLIASCDPLLEGSTAFHARPAAKRSSLKLVWLPGSRNYGKVHFRAWIVARHSEVYVLDSDYVLNEVSGTKTIPVKDDFYQVMLRVFNISRSAITTTSSAVSLSTGSSDDEPAPPATASSNSPPTHDMESVEVVSNSTHDDTEEHAMTLVVSFSGGRRVSCRSRTWTPSKTHLSGRLMTGFNLTSSDPFAHTKRDVPEFRDMFPEAPPPSFDSPLTAPFASDLTNPFFQSFGGLESSIRGSNSPQPGDSVRQMFPTGSGPTFFISGQAPGEVSAVRLGQQASRTASSFGANGADLASNANSFASQDFGMRLNPNNRGSSAAATAPFTGFSGQLGFPDFQTMLSGQTSPLGFQQQGFSQNQFGAGPFNQQPASFQNQQNLGNLWFGQQGFGQQGFGQQSMPFLSQTGAGGSAFGQQSGSLGQQQSSANPFSFFNFQQSASTFPATSNSLGFPNAFGSNSLFGSFASSSSSSSFSNLDQGRFSSFFGGSSGGSSSLDSFSFPSSFGGSRTNFGQIG
ncbi:nuclear pore complex protein NUP98B-like [Pomacea canaliculata]|uniref:nuclear pore complex protein NUP98B-like n=1 Tax=Pomacea canaliculata TaxID=400727 RepID=UPI000D72AA98|nr:nuclear pore complex protein NUP98B-like [Pomacea canaliculata]